MCYAVAGTVLANGGRLGVLAVYPKMGGVLLQTSKLCCSALPLPTVPCAKCSSTVDVLYLLASVLCVVDALSFRRHPCLGRQRQWSRQVACCEVGVVV